MKFRIGQLYHRFAIAEELGGSRQIYLPSVDRVVVGGCFRRDLNRRAPFIIDVGIGPQIEAAAEWLNRGGRAIPVFLKQGRRGWEYVGEYRARKLSRSYKDRQAGVKRSGRQLSGVLFLERSLPK